MVLDATVWAHGLTTVKPKVKLLAMSRFVDLQARDAALWCGIAENSIQALVSEIPGIMSQWTTKDGRILRVDLGSIIEGTQEK